MADTTAINQDYQGTNAAVDAVYHGYYTQPYADTVNPNAIWSGNKYFLRRWTAYLGAVRYWTVIGAQQAVYRANAHHKPPAYIYDAAIYAPAGVSRNTYSLRIKPEMGAYVTQHTASKFTGKTERTKHPLSLFISRGKATYVRDAGTTKKSPVYYWVRLDVPLTPADADHLMVWFGIGQGADNENAVIDILGHAVSLASNGSTASQLLAPQQKSYIKSTSTYTPITVFDIIQRRYPSAAKNTEVRKLADTLQHLLTGTQYQGTQYFRQQWVKQLKPGPAVLLTYLRSFCFHSDKETRNVVTGIKFTTLADSLGTSKRNIQRWIKTLLDPQIIPDQPLRPFLTEKMDGKRWPRDPKTNELLYTFTVQVHDPITPADWPMYEKQLKALGVRQNQTYTPPKSATKPNIHPKETSIEGGGLSKHNAEQNRTPDPAESATKSNIRPMAECDKTKHTLSGRVRQNQTYTGGECDKIKHTQGESATKPNIPQGESATKPNTIKYYKALLHQNNYLATAIPDGGEEKLLAAAASSNFFDAWHFATANQTFAHVAVGNLKGFCNAVGIAGKNNAVLSSQFTVAQVVAWYLYITHEGLEQHKIPGYIVNRVGEGEFAPEPFLQLASLSWALWRSYAVANYAPINVNSLSRTPAYDIWQNLYGRGNKDAQQYLDGLPLSVGAGIAATMDIIQPDDDDDEAVIASWGNGTAANTDMPLIYVADPTAISASPEETAVWGTAKSELELQMTRATYNTWLRDTLLLTVRYEGETAVYVIGVRNEYAKDWLENRLRDTILRTLTDCFPEDNDHVDVKIEFVVSNEELLDVVN